MKPKYIPHLLEVECKFCEATGTFGEMIECPTCMGKGYVMPDYPEGDE
jgi:hypothetical protein